MNREVFNLDVGFESKSMKIIREYSTYAKICVIRTNIYGSQLSHFMNLFNEAKKDFPDLKPEEVDIKQFGGRRYKRTFGIEFDRPEESVPETYNRIENLEHTL